MDAKTRFKGFIGQLAQGWHKIELGVEQVVGVQVEWKTAGESGPNWLSWSSLVILIGLGSLGILRWRRNAVAGPESQERGIQPNEWARRRIRGPAAG